MTYPEYLDELILEAAARQSGPDIQLVSLEEIHHAKFPESPLSWLSTAATELAANGYGVDWQDTSNTTFRLTGGGIRRAQEIRDARSKATLWGWIKATLSKDWIALLALVVSIIAIFKSGT